MVMPGTGELEQLVPDIEQIVDGEAQFPTRPSSPLIPLKEAEKRAKPTPTAPRPSLPSTEAISEATAIQMIYGTPVLKWNRLTISKTEWQELVRWDIPIGYTGDLRELALRSSNDEKTRWRVVLGNVDQDIPSDKQLTTPTAFPWRHTVIPGGTSCFVEVLSSDGTSFTVDASITGTVR